MKIYDILTRMAMIIIIIRQFYSPSIKIIYPQLMNNSFDYVIRSSLNHSKSKQTHLFSKAPKLNAPKLSNCAKSSYDLQKKTLTYQIMNKSIVFPKSERFRSQQRTEPSPDSYNRKSFLDINAENSKGNSFGRQGLDEKIKIAKKNTPGPGTYYDRYSPETNLAYTMRSKITAQDRGHKLGPGQYMMQKYEAIKDKKDMTSKYNNVKQIKFGMDTRFKEREITIPGPGAYNNRNKTQLADLSYRFSGSKREVALTIKQMSKKGTPGPGAYNKFSQFSELKGGLTKSRTNLGYNM